VAPPVDPVAPPVDPLSPPADARVLLSPLTPPGTPLELELRIRRDLARGRAIVGLTWLAAIGHLVLGLVVIRQSALLVSVDRRIVSTEEVDQLGSMYAAVGVIVIVVLVGIVLLAVRWLRGTLPVLDELRRRGAIDGPDPGGGWRRLALLWRPAGVTAERASWAELRVPGRPERARLAGLAVLVAATVGLVAMIGLAAATDASLGRGLRIVLGIDGALWLIATILVGSAIDDILWREAAAARALGVFIPLVDAPGRVVIRLLPPLLLFGAGVLIAAGRPDPWFVPCPESTLECDGMLVPARHDGGSNATIWVVYAIHHAVGTPAGTLAIAVGGPGASGLDEALPLVDALDPALVEHYDLLFWDQRGVGASEGRDCPRAGQAFATGDSEIGDAPAFVRDCLAEAKVAPADVARYATKEAAEDLESIRDHLGIERFALYGESYGTELAQTYAAAHPDRLTALILDGAVDLTRSANEFWTDAARSFDTVLTRTLESCTAERDCVRDVADPVDEYDRALARFTTPRTIEYADPDGAVRSHTAQSAGIESVVDTLLYDPAGREVIRRAVAAAAHGDDVPFGRLLELIGSGNGPGVSAFAYHAVTCADWRVSPTANPSDLDALLDYGQRAGVDRLRTDEIFTAQVPCLFWPYQPPTGDRPAAITATPFPVFVLGATGDPITPADGARAIASRLSDGYLVITEGGPHVTFGRGAACVDGPVVDFLLEGRRPATRTISCPGHIADEYVPLTASDRSGYGDALDAMIAAESELFADPEYVIWDGVDDLRVGCRKGGFFVVTALTDRDSVRFSDCAFVAGLPLTGLGSYTFASGDVAWSVTVPGGKLDYRATAASRHVSGTYEGKPVDISD
jgi:pimeloyl-ACP methyl ester carboxylesterase